MENNDLLTISEVAHILRVDGSTVRRWIQLGAMEGVILPHANKQETYRVSRETLNKILGKGEPPCREEPA